MSRLDFAKQMIKDHPEVYNWNYYCHKAKEYASYIHPSVDVPEWVEIGKGVIVLECTLLGSTGFAYEWDPEAKEWLHIPHIGKLIIEDNVTIFSHSNINRGTLKDTVIGSGTKIDDYVHIGHNNTIGKNCIFTSMSVTGGSDEFGDNVYIGLNSTIKDHVTIAEGVLIGQGTNVVKSIAEPWTIWAGNPAKFIRAR